MTKSYLEASNERQSRVALATLNAVQSTALASIQVTLSLTRVALGSPRFVVRVITQLTAALPRERVVEQQGMHVKLLTDIVVKPPNRGTRVGNARLVPADDELIHRRKAQSIDKQGVYFREASVSRGIAMVVKSDDMPLSHEELDIDRHAVTGDADVDGPIVHEMIRVPRAEERNNGSC